MAKATTAKAVQPIPTDPVELLSTPLARSGLAAGATLRRAGIKLDFYTVRDLLFHLPRRYDDLREMRHLGDLVWETDGTVVSAQARVGDVRVEPGFRGRTQRTIARLEDDTGTIDATWFGRRFIERRLRGRRRDRGVGQGQALRPEADARQPGVPGRERTTPSCSTPGGSCRSTR